MNGATSDGERDAEALFESARRELSVVVRSAFERALATFSLRAIVMNALPPLPPLRATVRLLAIGKAAVVMMAAAVERWGARIDRGLVVTVDGVHIDVATERAVDAVGVATRRAAHPVPDARIAAAGAAARALVRGHTH